jgi:hypothetical protein
MNLYRLATRGALAAAFGLYLAGTSLASTDDRVYQFGEDEGGSNGNTVATTFDSKGASGMDQLVDLTAVGGPVYRSYTGRPDGVNGLGIEFNGAQSQYLRGDSLNWPEESFSAIGGNFVGTLNYNGIADRGMQFWVRPGATGVQSIVMDSNQHGVRINESGNFSMRYNNRDTDSGVPVTAGTWYHIMVVRPEGTGGGSRMYVDGIAVAADNLSDYAASSANLVIGSNTGGDDGLAGGVGFTGGTEEFFTGLIDDMNMFVIGDNSSNAGPPPGMNWGDFDFATENAYAELVLSGQPGDVDNNGMLNQADKDDFIAGWMNEHLVDDVRVGDLNSLASGDLNFDGITDIFDLAIMQNALTGNGLSAITAAELHSSRVPEPAGALAAVLLLALGATIRAAALKS